MELQTQVLQFHLEQEMLVQVQTDKLVFTSIRMVVMVLECILLQPIHTLLALELQLVLMKVAPLA